MSKPKVRLSAVERSEGISRSASPLALCAAALLVGIADALESDPALAARITTALGVEELIASRAIAPSPKVIPEDRHAEDRAAYLQNVARIGRTG